MSDPLSRIAASVPAPSHALLSRLLADPLRPAGELLAELDAYLGFVQSYAAGHAAVDAVWAARLTERCRALIARTSGHSDDDRLLVQAARLYLVAIEGDLDDGDGFHDDEAVIF